MVTKSLSQKRAILL